MDETFTANHFTCLDNVLPLGQVLRPSLSDPALHVHENGQGEPARIQANYEMGWTLSDGLESNSESDGWCSEDDDQISQAGCTTGSSSESDSESEYSCSEDGAEIIVGGADLFSRWSLSQAQRSWKRCGEANVVKLSEVHSLPRSSEGTVLSYGSIAHFVEGETCKACVFNNKPGRSCRHGLLCRFCHADHMANTRPKRKFGRKYPMTHLQ